MAYRREGAPPFFFDPRLNVGSALLRGWDEGQESPSVRADALARGVLRYFGHADFDVGCPPEWHTNPWTGERVPADRHWTRIGDFAHGDMKAVWEPGRFRFAYDLVRAFARDGDESRAELFWRLVEDWRDRNPPFRGPHWKCGQEVSLRVMAWCFGLYAFLGSRATSPERVADLAQMVAASGYRIEATLDYALSQRNNHGISEGVGLWTIGSLFPEFRRARRWAELGRKILERLGRSLIYDDGAFAQHSVNYHRLMLHAYVWTLRLGDILGRPFSPRLRERVRRAGEWLYQLQDGPTGRVPWYGHHDGALILPLDNCEDQDYRPVLQATHYLTEQRRLFGDGPWDEDLYWLFGRQAVSAPAQARGAPTLRADVGGYHTLRASSGFAFLRAATFRHRPAQADLLHLDLWWHGQNVALDAGTYSYNAPAPWDNALAGTSCHNTITVDGRDQMRRAGRFLWLPWARGAERVRRVSGRGRIAYWEGAHDGYARLDPPALHRRAVVRLGEEHWLVLDDVASRGPHQYRLHWLLNDWPWEWVAAPAATAGGGTFASLAVETPAGRYGIQIGTTRGPAVGSLARAEAGSVRGWRSTAYLRREPALSLELIQESASSRFWTAFGPAGYTATSDKSRLSIRTPSWTAVVEFSTGPGAPIVARVGLEGEPGRPPGDRSMNVLLIHQAFVSGREAGGMRHYEFGLRLAARGDRLTVITGRVNYLTGRSVGDGMRRPPLREDVDGLKVLRVYTPAVLHRGFARRVLAFLVFATTSTWAGLRSGPIDLVMGTTPPIFQALSAWIVARVRRRPFLLEVRDLWPEFAVGMGVLKNPVLIRLARTIEQFLYRHSDHILVNSPAYRDYLVARGVPSGRISLIPNGADVAMFDPDADGASVRDRFGLRLRFLVVYAGAIGMANCLGTVLKAADLLRGQDDVHFLLVGDGKERTNLEREACRLGLRNVTFAGPVSKDRMPEVLAAADACLATLMNIPMFTTTYPNKVFDYMAAGRPTLLAIDGVIRAVVEEAGGGLFIPPEDPDALARAVIALRDDADGRVRMGRRRPVLRRRAFRSCPAIRRVPPTPVSPRGSSHALHRTASMRRRPCGNVANRGHRTMNDRLKRTTDVVISATSLLLASPLMAIIASGVVITMGRPVFFRQTRPGYQGRPFTLLKFRTMRNAIGPDGRPLPDSQRVTRFGRLLRRTSLDELPQLWNVLMGELSLVGPRPLLMEYLPLYTPKQMRRHEVKPGITGWAQVNGRNTLSWEEKLTLDVWYVEHCSILLDLKILGLTTVRVLSGEGVAARGEATVAPFRGSSEAGP